MSGLVVPTLLSRSNGALTSGAERSRWIAVDLTCRVSNEGANWTVAGTAAEDVFKLEAEAYSAFQAATAPAMASPVVLTTSAQDLEAAVTAGADRYVYFRLTAPTSTTTPNEQTIQIEIGVTP